MNSKDQEVSAEVPWITEPSEIAGASDASLRRSLLTIDGCGRVFKSEVLDEIIRRAKTEDRK